MPLRMIGGRAGTGKTTKCLEEIAAKVKENPEGQLLLLIVPEQASLQMEQELARKLGGLWRVQVLSFQRLAWRILSETGGQQKIRLTESGSRMLLSKIMLQRQWQYAPLAASPGLAELMLCSVLELKTEGITPQALLAVSGRLPEEGLREKIADLALIYKEYEDFLAQAMGDGTDLLTDAVQQLPFASFLKQAEIWLDGFTGFSWQERTFIEAFLKGGHQVTVVTPWLPEGESEQKGEMDILAKPRRTYAQLRELAADLQTVYLTEPRRWSSPVLRHLERYLFRYPVQPFTLSPSEKGDLRICYATDPRQEMVFVAEEIRRLVSQEGLSYGEIALVTRDLASYGELAAQVFTGRGIPFFTDYKRNVTGHPLAALLMNLLDLLRHPWQHEPLFACLKTGFFPLSQEATDLLENYCLARGIEPWEWEKGDAFSHLPEELMESVAALRALFRTFFDSLADLAAEERYGVRLLTAALYDFFTALTVPETLAAWQGSAAEAGAYETAQVHQQIWEALLQLWDELVSILDDEELPPEDYATILRAGLQAVEVGVAPPRLREVKVGSLERSRLPEVSVLFLLGANDGLLPPQYEEAGLFDDRDRQRLHEAGLTLSPRGKETFYEELLFLYAALSKATNRLIVTYSLGDGEGKRREPSFVVRRLKELYPDLREEFQAKKSARYKIANWNLPLEASLPLPTRQALYGEKRKISVTQLERYSQCPFSYYAQAGLRLKPRQKYQVNKPEVGTLFHEVLCDFGRALGDYGAEMTPEQYRVLMDRLFHRHLQKPAYRFFQRNHRHRFFAERIRKILAYVAEILAEHMIKGGFVPVGLEVAFGDEARGWPPLACCEEESGTLALTGKIDRVDAAIIGDETYLRVIDYKSSDTLFDLEKFHYGLSLQLPVYLETALMFAEAADSTKDPLPAGFLYFPVIEPELRENRPLPSAEAAQKKKQALKVRGFLLADLPVLTAMDEDLREGRSELLGLKYNQNGSLSRNQLTLPPEHFDLLRQHLQEMLQKQGRLLLQGDIRVLPYKCRDEDGCRYCLYSSVCHFDADLPEFHYRYLPALSEDEIWRIWEEGDVYE